MSRVPWGSKPCRHGNQDICTYCKVPCCPPSVTAWKDVCSPVCPWLPKPQEVHKKLWEAEPSSGILQQPRDCSLFIRAWWRTNDFQPSRPAQKRAGGVWRAGRSFFIPNMLPPPPHAPPQSPGLQCISLSPLLIVWAVSEPLLGIVCAIRGVKGGPQK